MSLTESAESLPGEAPKRLPEVLNVLTILTYIGCGLGLLFTILSFVDARSNFDNEMERHEVIGKSPVWAQKMMGDNTVEIARLTYENRLPVFLCGLVGVFLCFLGARQMRNLQKKGFITWIIGEVIPLVSILIFIGPVAYERLASVLSIFFPLAFIVLYNRQRKYLVK